MLAVLGVDVWYESCLKWFVRCSVACGDCSHNWLFICLSGLSLVINWQVFRSASCWLLFGGVHWSHVWFYPLINLHLDPIVWRTNLTVESILEFKNVTLILKWSLQTHYYCHERLYDKYSIESNVWWRKNMVYTFCFLEVLVFVW